MTAGARRRAPARSRGGCGSGPSAPRTPATTTNPAPGRPARCRGWRPGVVCVVSGHTAMVSFADLPGRVSLEEIERHWPDLLPGLVDHDGVGFLLVHSDEFGPVVLGRDGAAPAGDRRRHRRATRCCPTASTPRPWSPASRRSRTAPTSSSTAATTPTPTRRRRSSRRTWGSHGGWPRAARSSTSAPSGWRAIALVPDSAPGPAGEIVGAEQLHRVLRGWLTDLGHPEPDRRGRRGRRGEPDRARYSRP